MSTDERTTTDVLVIGGGPAGYTAAIRAAQLDRDVTIVEKDAYGGACLNHGCIPSKALISATNLAHRAADAEHMGIHADPAVDVTGLVDWKDGVVDRLTRGVEQLCKGNGVSLVSGRAEFVDEGAVRVVGDDREETIAFEHAVIATGSRPVEIPGFSFDDEPILDSRQALAVESVPESLLVVGAGYIGMELAGVFAKLKSDVTVIEMLDGALPGYDDDLVRPVKKRAEEFGIDFHFGLTAEGWEDNGDGTVTVTAQAADDVVAGGDEETNDRNERSDAESTEFVAEKVLVAVGRAPVTDTLNLEAIPLETDERGFLTTDEKARTDVEGIYAVGDVAGEPMLAHKGMVEGEVAAEVIAGEPAALDRRAIPAAVFTDPEISTVGMTSQDASEADLTPVVGEFPFRASGRALTADEREGFVRVVADAETEVLLGGAVVGPDASELVAELTLAVEMSATLEDVAATVHTHPTLAEAVMEACKNARGEAIHTLNR